MNTIINFIDQLVAEKGFETEDVEVLDQIKSDLMTRLEDRINAMIINNIGEEHLADFDAIVDSKNEEKMALFIKANISDFDEKLAQEMISFRLMYLK